MRGIERRDERGDIGERGATSRGDMRDMRERDDIDI